MHQRLMYYCNRADLEPTATRQLEREANEFGAATLFQGGRFTTEGLGSRFSLSALRQHCRDWQVSFEAGFRRFVEQHPEPVALAVCRPMGSSTIAYGDRRARAAIAEVGAELRYWVGSTSYRGRGRDLARGEKFESGHVIVDAMSSGRSDHYSEVTIGNATLPMALFFTSWSALIVIGLEEGHQALKLEAVEQ